MAYLEDPNEVLKWDTEQLWNYINTVRDELEEDQELELKRAETGINIEFPIQYLVKGYFEEYPSNKKALVKGYGKVDLMEFWKEKEERETIIRRIIYEIMDDKSPIKSRT